jgi:hypothetical protein
MTPTLQDLAEDAFAYVEGPFVEFDRRDRFILRNTPNPHPLFGMVLRPRLEADEIDAVIADARTWFRARDRTQYTWLVADTSSTPADLAGRLRNLGLVDDELDAVYAGMTLEQEPPAVDGVEVRKSETYEDSLAAAEIGWRSFELTGEQIEVSRIGHRERWDVQKDFGGFDQFIATVDGEIVGSGGAAYTAGGVYLINGNVAEQARGRGVTVHSFARAGTRRSAAGRLRSSCRPARCRSRSSSGSVSGRPARYRRSWIRRRDRRERPPLRRGPRRLG